MNRAILVVAGIVAGIVFTTFPNGTVIAAQKKTGKGPIKPGIDKPVKMPDGTECPDYCFKAGHQWQFCFVTTTHQDTTGKWHCAYTCVNSESCANTEGSKQNLPMFQSE